MVSGASCAPRGAKTTFLASLTSNSCVTRATSVTFSNVSRRSNSGAIAELVPQFAAVHRVVAAAPDEIVDTSRKTAAVLQRHDDLRAPLLIGIVGHIRMRACRGQIQKPPNFRVEMGIALEML